VRLTLAPLSVFSPELAREYGEGLGVRFPPSLLAGIVALRLEGLGVG